MQILALLFFSVTIILSMGVIVAMLSNNAARIAQALRGNVVSRENRVTFVTFGQHGERGSTPRPVRLGVTNAAPLPLAA